MFQSISHCYLVMVVLLNSLQQEKSGIGWNSSMAFLSYCSIPVSRSGHVEWRWSLASSLDLTPSARGLGEVQEDVWTAWASSRGGDPASAGSLHNYITQLCKAESHFLPVQCISLVLRNGQSCLCRARRCLNQCVQHSLSEAKPAPGVSKEESLCEKRNQSF